MKSLFAVVIALLISISGSISFAEEPYASPVQQVYPGVSKAELWQSVMKSLANHDLPVVASDFERGKIRARQHNYLNRAWAHCASTNRRSFSPTNVTNLRSRSAPIYRGVDLMLEILDTADGALLALTPRYSNVDRDYGRRSFAFEVPCQSTGILEQALFAASDKAG